MPAAKPRPLSPREEMFAREYALCGNGRLAAVAAGYGRAGAAVQAHRCLQRPAVQRAVSKAVAERNKALLASVRARAEAMFSLC